MLKCTFTTLTQLVSESGRQAMVIGKGGWKVICGKWQVSEEGGRYTVVVVVSWQVADNEVTEVTEVKKG